MISEAVPVSPSLGKIRAMLFMWASGFISVMASMASVTLKPNSCAWRDVDSTPMLVATPAMTTCVTPSVSEVRFEVRARKCAPGPLRHRVVFRLPVQLRHKLGPIGWKLAKVARLLGPAWRASGDIDEDHRQTKAAKGVRERAGVLHHLAHRMGGGTPRDTFLQIDDDEGGPSGQAWLQSLPLLF